MRKVWAKMTSNHLSQEQKDALKNTFSLTSWIRGVDFPIRSENRDNQCTGKLPRYRQYRKQVESEGKTALPYYQINYYVTVKRKRRPYHLKVYYYHAYAALRIEE